MSFIVAASSCGIPTTFPIVDPVEGRDHRISLDSSSFRSGSRIKQTFLRPCPSTLGLSVIPIFCSHNHPTIVAMWSIINAARV